MTLQKQKHAFNILIASSHPIALFKSILNFKAIFKRYKRKVLSTNHLKEIREGKLYMFKINIHSFKALVYDSIFSSKLENFGCQSPTSLGHKNTTFKFVLANEILPKKEIFLIFLLLDFGKILIWVTFVANFQSYGHLLSFCSLLLFMV